LYITIEVWNCNLIMVSWKAEGFGGFIMLDMRQLAPSPMRSGS
jgi:hypothetical protein